ncbi:TadE/TadG family type IV pilus assembly protein [Planctomicrobium sp. SH664]|uniref:TadE/TadG family type IV pilus assembly protein n=1 Tax=Planctomicrobium sp. SH664 TaxID=3448125 RepID=UPI003F5BAF83
MQRRPTIRRSTAGRRGVVLVENALVISAFGIFLAGILEIGHTYMVISTLNTAAKRAARYGACEQITTQQVKEHANSFLSKSFKSSKATIQVKDAGVFDTSNVTPGSIDYAALPNLELSNAKARQLYIVRITVPYKDVALIPPFWVKNLTLKGQAVMRHE